jgi:hypothetical protein
MEAIRKRLPDDSSFYREARYVTTASQTNGNILSTKLEDGSPERNVAVKFCGPS